MGPKRKRVDSDPVSDTIVVQLRPNSYEEDPTDPATFRPNAPPNPEVGKRFEPLIVEDREIQVKPLPPSPLALFLEFVPRWLAEKWVEWTNTFEPTWDEGKRHARGHRWYDTNVEEVYLFFLTLIYMCDHTESSVDAYWMGSDFTPYHPIIGFFSRNRWQALYRRLRMWDHKDQPASPFERCREWSEWVQSKTLELCIPGSNITVDECICRYNGRTLYNTTIPNKADDTGFKEWVLAFQGLFLQWTGHHPGSGEDGGPIDVPKPKGPVAKREGDDLLNNTQRVVTFLIDTLQSTYPLPFHVFTDNLFSTPYLFTRLRERGVAATGTCRKNCGMAKRLTDLKDAPGPAPRYNTVKQFPTPDNLVNQMAWADNNIVLMLSTRWLATERIEDVRVRPKEGTKWKNAARDFFKDNRIKKARIPKMAYEYNHNMNGVDLGDQRRSNFKWDHSLQRNAAQAFMYNFLPQVIVSNCFLLQKWGNPSWEPYTNATQYRRALIDEGIRHFGSLVTGRQKSSRSSSRAGNMAKPIDQHRRVSGKTNSKCQACLGNTVRGTRRVGLQVAGDGVPNRQKTPTTRSRCDACDVALCRNDKCWYMYHSIK